MYKYIVYDDYTGGGGNDVSNVLKFVEEKELPIPKKNELLIKVLACSLNASDSLILRGDLKHLPSFMKPTYGRLCSDGCGVVVQTVEASTFQVNDVVCFDMEMEKGCCATHVSVPYTLCVLKPPNLSPIDAASGIGTAQHTAWKGVDSLLSYAKPKENEPLMFLVLGGSSGVGSFSIRYLTSLGHKCIATASMSNAEFVMKECGAVEVIDYKTNKWWDVLKERNVRLDGIHQAIFSEGDYEHAYDFLNNERGAAFVTSDSIPKPPSIMKLMFQTLKRKLFGRVKYDMYISTATQESLMRCKNEIGNNKHLSAPKPTSTYAFNDEKSVYEAFQIAVDGHAVGKMIIYMDDSDIDDGCSGGDNNDDEQQDG